MRRMTDDEHEEDEKYGDENEDDEGDEDDEHEEDTATNTPKKDSFNHAPRPPLSVITSIN